MTTIHESQDLVAALSASDVMVRVAAIGDLVRQPEAARPQLAVILADLALPPRPRVWAMIAICHVGHGDAPEILRGLLDSLTDASPIVRRSAVETLGVLRVHSAVPQIAKCLMDHAPIPEAWFDDDATPAQAARRALALIASPEAKALLASIPDV
ncbi:MAG TPA: hypothetical protein VGK73_26150 [Polyangiaceae bacterium]